MVIEELCNLVEQLNLADLETLGKKVGYLLPEARVQAQQNKATAPSEELLPNWACFSGTSDDIIRCLNSHGVDLIDAIRNGSGDGIRTAMRILRETQFLHADCGADDTEGRTAIWELVQDACIGTAFDPEKFWNEYYE